MSELHIRINKRAVERAFFLVVIIVLAILLFLRWDAPAVDANEFALLQEENEALTAEVADLESEVADLQAENEALQTPEEPETTPEPEPEPEPEEQLSGDIEANFDVTMDGSRFVRAAAVIENGRDRSEDLSYFFYWDGLSPSTVNERGNFYLASGASRTLTFSGGDGGLPANPPSTTDTLVLEITDSNGSLVAEFREVVR